MTASRPVRTLCMGALLAFAALASPSPAFTAIEGLLTVEISFVGACATHGRIIVTGATFDPSTSQILIDQEVDWSDQLSIETAGQPVDVGPPFHLELIDQNGAVVFATDAIVRRGWAAQTDFTYEAALDCSTVPYVPLPWGAAANLQLAFRGDCDVNGHLAVLIRADRASEFTVMALALALHWSERDPIEVGTTQVGFLQEKMVLRLFDSDEATVLFESKPFRRPSSETSGWRYVATLDCSQVPYVVLLADSAVDAPRAGPSAVALTVSGLVLVLLGMGWLLVARQRHLRG